MSLGVSKVKKKKKKSAKKCLTDLFPLSFINCTSLSIFLPGFVFYGILNSEHSVIFDIIKS